MLPAEATAIVGLFLRSRSDFTIAKGATFSDGVSRGLFYWILARALLGSAWRWFSACVASSTATGDDALTYLGQSALQRFDRLLRARDAILRQAQLPPDRDAGDEAIFFLDVALLMLSGAFDVAARVAHRAYGVTLDVHLAGWRRKAWRTSIVAAEPAFGSLLATGSLVADMLEIVGRLRNTVHGAGLQGIAYSEGSLLSHENLVQLPAGEHEVVVEAMDRHAGHAAWGVRPLGAGLVALEPDTFVEALVPRAAVALNALMDATDVTRLSGVRADDLPGGPPVDDQLFSASMTRSVRLLGGLPTCEA